MVKVIRAYDLSDGTHVFSIAADSKKFVYVFEDKERQIFDPVKRVNLVMSKVKEGQDLDIEYLLDIATFNLRNFRFSKPFEESSLKLATDSEKVQLKRVREASYSDSRQQMDVKTYDEIDQVFADYPDLYDQLSSEDPNQKITADGMIELMFATLGSVDPNGPYDYLVKHLDREKSEEPVVAAAEGDACPPATQDIQLNLKNRQNAIDNIGYGPLNPQEPNDEFWQKKATRWSVSIEDAKTSRCGNCAAFIVTSKMKDCIAQGLQQGGGNVEDSYDVVVQGELGYCEALDFKCAASRTCDAWIAGGPVTDETGKEQA
jgi:hypothetical protein